MNNRIKELRNSAMPKITLKELSVKLKEKGLTFTDSQLSKFENGTSSPRSKVSTEFWSALAEIFETNVPFLLGYENSIKDSQAVHDHRKKEAQRILSSLKSDGKVSINIDGEEVEVPEGYFSQEILENMKTAPQIADLMQGLTEEVLDYTKEESDKDTFIDASKKNRKFLIGTRPKELRTSLDLSKKEFADEIELTEPVISSWENGTSSPSLEEINNISDIFGVSPTFLIGIEADLDKDSLSVHIEKGDFSNRYPINNIFEELDASKKELLYEVALKLWKLQRMENGE